MSLINVLLVLIGAVLAFVFHRSTSPSGINSQNKKTLDDVNTLQTKVDQNNVSIQQEEQKIQNTDKEVADEKAKVVTPGDVADFFNERKS